MRLYTILRRIPLVLGAALLLSAVGGLLWWYHPVHPDPMDPKEVRSFSYPVSYTHLFSARPSPGIPARQAPGQPGSPRRAASRPPGTARCRPCLLYTSRAEAFASKNGPGRSALDGLSMGLGFTVALTLISAVRELLGAGTLLGFPVLGDRFEPATMMILPPGGFLVLGCLIALVQFIMQRKGAKK